MKETGRVIHVMHGQLVADPIKDTRVGRASREAIKLLNEDNIIKQVEERGMSLIDHISSRLGDKVYRPEDRMKSCIAKLCWDRKAC